MLSQVLIVCLILFYYWYFYFDTTQPIPKPDRSKPSPSSAYSVQFLSDQFNHFKFVSNGVILWEHHLPNTPYAFHNNQIVPQDACHRIADGLSVIAKGQVLYEYLKKHQVDSDLFQENVSHPVQEGNVYYFTCLHGRIEQLHICPSGSTFKDNRCQKINACMGKPDGFQFPHSLITQYVECIRDQEVVQKCPDGTFYHINLCTDMNDLNNYCKFNLGPKIINDYTKVECRNRIPYYVHCPPGTKFFDQTHCEPANCDGYADNTKLSLPEQRNGPFIYTPGYMRCHQNKIAESVDCPFHWDHSLTQGDNLTSLPMVFDGQKCSIPTFCENVFSDDPDVIVPLHEFTKNVKNWALSETYDASAGYKCDQNKKRKLTRVPDGMRISKKFKLENACSSTFLPIYEAPSMYYDCNTHSSVSCPNKHFFNGTQCVPLPDFKTFTFKNVPLFHFKPFLNAESWIHTWEYNNNKKLLLCDEPESTYLDLYNICSHPECEHLAFLSTIPDLALFLPRDKQAKCVYDKLTNRLKKVSVPFQYSYWDQKEIIHGEESHCTPGQNVKTGNFIWDQTIFATCHPLNPFIFCPSSNGLIAVNPDQYACAPPDSNAFTYSSATSTPFMENEVQAIGKAADDLSVTEIQLRKGGPFTLLTDDKLDIPVGAKINLSVTAPVEIQLRYRVTHPPNVAFKYDEDGKVHFKTSTPDRGFMPKLNSFTAKSLNFPRYESQSLVQSFQPRHNIP